MRIPSGPFVMIAGETVSRFGPYVLLGALGPEKRCLAVPTKISGNKKLRNNWQSGMFVEIGDPHDAFPDHSKEASDARIKIRNALTELDMPFDTPSIPLLATEDELLDVLDRGLTNLPKTVILDISGLPKRFFGLWLKRLLLSNQVEQLLITYTSPGSYPEEHLSEDPLPCDHLPAFAGSLPPTGSTLVVSLGFEPLGLRSLADLYKDQSKTTKVITAFPCSIDFVARQWRALIETLEGDSRALSIQNIEPIAPWDVERVITTLRRWKDDAEGLVLAPFGPKPHTLGMLLFAIRDSVAVYYTQPKSYHPNYSVGAGETTTYVVKWEGVPCTAQ
jgi:hypothetical protein